MSDHEGVLLGTLGSSDFRGFTAYEPLTPEEFRSLSEADIVKNMPDAKMTRLWLVPIQRMLQQSFQIDQRSYSTGTVPTLAELDEDFKVATVICIDKFSLNESELSGNESVSGSGSMTWDNKVPPRAEQLLARYKNRGGRIGRA